MKDVLLLELPLRVVLKLGRPEFLSVLLDRTWGRPPDDDEGLAGGSRALAAVFSAVVARKEGPNGDVGAELSSSKDGISVELEDKFVERVHLVEKVKLIERCAYLLTTLVFVFQFRIMAHIRCFRLIDLH